MEPEQGGRKLVRASDGLGGELPVSTQATQDGRVAVLVGHGEPAFLNPRQTMELIRNLSDLAHWVLPRWPS